jgi:hypothetical protein
MKRFLVPGVALLALVLVSLLMFLRPAERAFRQRSASVPVNHPATSPSPLPTADFEEWLQRVNVTALTPSELESGQRYAEARQPRMLALMQSDPQEALRQSVSFAEYASLPESIQAFVEEPFSALAEVRVLPICEPGASRHTLVEIDFDNGINHDAYIYGRRHGVTSKHRTPVQGIRMEGVAAVWESTFLELGSEDVEAVADRFPLANVDPGLSFASGEPVGENAVTALAGGQQFVFKDVDELAAFDAAVSKLEELPGPDSGAGLLFAMPKGADGSEGFDLDALASASQAQASSWTETPKSVFLIRVDFPDKTSTTDPLPAAGDIEQVFDTTVDAQIQAMSYGKTEIECTVTTTITRMPSPTTTYTPVGGNNSSNNDLLLDDAKSAYATANPMWMESDYDIVGVYFVSIGMKGSGITYAGLAGGSDLWLQGFYGTELVVHELGHNYGLGHSSFWTPPGVSTNPVDPGGSNEEYGDDFDIMGDGPIPTGHFNAQAKAHVNWVETSDWTDVNVAGSGQFRIYRIDDPAATGLRGLRVTKGADEYYWIALRRAFVNESFNYGAYLQWERPGFSRAWLLDTTPDSQPGNNDKQDAGLLIGKTYSDASAGVHITPVARGGSTPNEWLDVQVNLGGYPGNQAPMVTIDGPSTVPARTTAFLTANATDGDNDMLAYSWDLGDGTTADNNPSIPYSWTLGGTYTVTVTVSDMKGGTATASKMITVTDTIDTWTTRTTGKTVDWNGIANNGSRVVLVGDNSQGNPFNGAWAWSTDGTTWTSGDFGSNEHLYDVCYDGTQFIAVGEKYRFGSDQWEGLILTSTDGAAWTQRYWTGLPLRSVACGTGMAVVGGDSGTLLRSTNGTSWSAVGSAPVPSTHRIDGLAYGNNVFVLTAYTYDFALPGYSGGHVVATSGDGLTWTDQSSGTTIDSWKDLRRTAFLNDRFFSSGWYSQFCSSIDSGMSFVQIRSDYEELPAMAYGQGIYLAGGIMRTLPSTVETPVVIASQNGTSWSPIASAAQPGMNAAGFFNNSFIIIGEDDLIRQSGTIAAGASGYVSWRNANFPDRGSDSRLDGDGDYDTLKTLVEYGVGASPQSGAGVDGVNAVPTPTTSDANPLLAGRLTLCFSIPDPAPSDVRYTVEVHNALTGTWSSLAQKTGTGGWIWLGGGTARVVTSSSGGRETVKVADTVLVSAGGPRFIRLKVEIAPAGP